MCSSIFKKLKEEGWSLKLIPLICFFAAAAWIQVNGIWVELPLLVTASPQQWKLPSYLTVVIQLANIAPFLYLLLAKYLKVNGRKVISEIPTIYVVLAIEVIASFILAFTWKLTSKINNEYYSLYLICLTFLIAAVDAVSSVTFLPFMANFPQKYMVIFYIGAGLSGFFPSIAALIQGIGNESYTCREVHKYGNGSRSHDNGVESFPGINTTNLVALYTKAHPRFPVQIFFFFITTILSLSLISFIILARVKETTVSTEKQVTVIIKENTAYDSTMETDRDANIDVNQENDNPPTTSTSSHEKYILPRNTVILLLILNGTINCFGNGVLPALQSYACLPYGNKIYHLTLTLSAVINPVACFLYFFINITSPKTIIAGVVLYLSSASYTIGIASTSPCPVMKGSVAGGAIVLTVTVIGAGLVSYLRTAISTVLRQQGRKALLHCGISVQLGSLVGALTMFPMVSVYNVFKQSVPCRKC